MKLRLDGVRTLDVRRLGTPSGATGAAKQDSTTVGEQLKAVNVLRGSDSTLQHLEEGEAFLTNKGYFFIQDSSGAYPRKTSAHYPQS